MMLSTPRSIMRCMPSRLFNVQTWVFSPAARLARICRGGEQQTRRGSQEIQDVRVGDGQTAAGGEQTVEGHGAQGSQHQEADQLEEQIVEEQLDDGRPHETPRLAPDGR